MSLRSGSYRVSSNADDPRSQTIVSKFTIFKEEVDTMVRPLRAPVDLGQMPISADSITQIVENAIEFVEVALAAHNCSPRSAAPTNVLGVSSLQVCACRSSPSRHSD